MNNNNKKRIFIAVIFILLLFFLLTFAGGRSEVALVEFIDGFDNSVIDSQEVEIGDDAVVPEDPKHKNYVFAGWFLFEDHDIKVTDFTNIEEDLKVIALYAGDANNNGIADDQDDRFVVTFKDGLTNDVIKTESVIVGLNATAPTAPTHRGYTFIGWDKGYTNIVENTTVTAEYERNEVAVTMYTVTFIDGDTREVIATQKVQEGKAATLPEAPKHENRVFVEWAGEYSNVKENTTITAIYADDMNNDGIEDATQPHYDVTYYDYNDEVIEVIEDVLVDMPTPTIADPERQYYTFNGWNPEVAETVTDNADYTATYVPVTDENGNGKADEEEAHFTVTYNVDGQTFEVFEDVLVDTETPVPAEKPEKTDYVFVNWGEVSEFVTEDATYNAVWADDKNNNGTPDSEEAHFTITYKVDGQTFEVFEDVLVDTETPVPAEKPEKTDYVFVNWGEVAEFVTEDATYNAVWADDKNNNETPDNEEAHFTITYKVDGQTFEVFEDVLVDTETPVPAKKPEKTDYVFVNWGEVAKYVTEDATYNAVWADDKNNNEIPDNEDTYYKVTFIDGLKQTQIGETQSVLTGMAATEPTVPTHEGYVFTGWDKEFDNVTSDLTVTATYAVDANGNGTPDNEDTYFTVTYQYDEKNIIDTISVLVNMPTPTIADPTKTNYHFVSWDPAIAKIVTDNAVYTAVFAPDHDENGNGKADEEEEYFNVSYVDVTDAGTETYYSASVLVNMPTPTISDPDKLNYVFTGWNPVPAEKVTEKATYYATWADDKNNNDIADNVDTYHTVTFVDGHNDETIDTQRVLTKMAATEPTVPTHDGYVFIGWDKEFDNVTSDLTVTATYAEDANGNGTPDDKDTYHTVTFVDGHTGNTIDTQSVLTKMAATEPIVPIHQGYVFTGWDKEFDNVTSDLTVTATYAVDANGNGTPDDKDTYHTVTFVDGHTGNTIDTQSVLTKMAATEPTVPTHEGYIFTEWDKEFDNVTSDLTVTAEYAEDKNGDKIPDSEQTLWEVRFYNEGVQIGNVQYVVDGEAAVAPTNPTKNGYSFNRWDKEFANVTSNLDVNATFVDDIAPSVSASTSLDVDKNISTVTVTTTDAGTGVKVVKHLRGEHTAEEVLEKGNDITSTGKFEEDVNGIHTIYAEDNAGNVTVTTIEITDIVFTPGDDFFDKYVTFDFGDIYGWYNSVVNLTANDDVKIKKIRIYQSDDSLLQAGCEIFGWCETRSRYATMAEMENNAAVPEDMVELDLTGKYNENGFIEPLTISTDASPDRFTIYVELDYKGQTVKRLYKFRLAHIAGQ